MKLIIDIETIAYRHASSNEKEYEINDGLWGYFCDVESAKFGIEQDIERFISFAPDHTPTLAIGDKNNFRYGVWPTYKGQRRKYRKPAGYGTLREWYRENWEVKQIPNVEADDVVGLIADDGDIIVSGDKDLKTIPGLHLSGEEVVEISQREADMNFYKQVLVGDVADNFPGCPTIGNANPMFKKDNWIHAPSDMVLWAIVVETFARIAKKLPDKTPSPLKMARCARILRAGEYDSVTEQPLLWTPPMEPARW